eukprot:CAMPEP_0197831984 /NCGR_PEP_ID=MMETSP1437-20131217/12881_1 /TAXON_ID=49252 ORGANISM="Eucampia antarctica, Strain CCMP1452" /NCGR_SAMPLE_ID=MMETSP1437 /ASSEMBLY_ACC=CAM_ASM_001096 /LENGTH=240 /DNA_ID=CAMNT_0043435139 /DNA_START=68 /DNA_END=790 /DNA_ORIENTATION=+
MKFCIATLLLPTAATAFMVAPQSTPTTTTSLQGELLNGWVPDESKFAYGLPGSLEPAGEFDPLGISAATSLTQLKQYREAETAHGRVAMLAVIGFIVTEDPVEYHPLFATGTRDIGPAIRHLDEVRIVAPQFFEVLALIIGGLEFYRATTGWATPGNPEENILKEDYYPGDIGFDPLNLKPDNWEDFSEMSTKELQNGRLAMLGIAGFVAQELVNGKEIFVNLGLVPDDFDPTSLPVQFN